MGYKFDKRGFLVIPDPRDLRLKHQIEKAIEKPVVVVKHAYCPNGHDLVWDYTNFNGFPGIHLKVRRPDGNEGEMVLSPIFGDCTSVSLGIKLVDGEKLDIFCPECGERLPILTKCDKCENGEIRGLSLDKDFDIANGIAFCDVVGCPSAYIVDSGDLIEQAYIEG